MFEDSENNIFCFKPGGPYGYGAQCAAPETMSSTRKQLKYATAIFCLCQFLMNHRKTLVFRKGLAKMLGPCPACIEYFLLGNDSVLEISRLNGIRSV